MGDVPLSPERFPFSPPFVRTPYELHVSSEHHTGGCPQFLDCRLDAKSLGRFWAYFREIPQTGESAIASARRQVELVPVPLDDTGQPGDYDYKIDANRALEAFTGRWVPVPFLRLSNEQWKDGAFKCEKGPSNWARLHVSREDSDGAYRLTFLFDTTIEEREQPTGQYFALCDDDVAENAVSHFRPKAATTRGSSIRCGSTNGSPKSTMPTRPRATTGGPHGARIRRSSWSTSPRT